MSNPLIPLTNIKSKIYLIRGMKVMFDSDLASLYEVETKNLNKAVRRNIDRFPEDFMFQLSLDELKSLRFQFGTSNVGRGGRRTSPYVFTQDGISMLSSVLKSKKAIQVNIQIMRVFSHMRALILENKELSRRLLDLERKVDHQYKTVFDAIREIMSTHAVPRKRITGLGEDD